LKKEGNSTTELIDDKLKVFVELPKIPVLESTVENEGELFNEETQTQNLIDQKHNSASTSKNTENQTSALNIKKSKHNSTKEKTAKSKHDKKSLAGTTFEKNKNKQQEVQLADSVQRLSTLNINSKQISPGSTPEETEDVIQPKDNDVNQNQLSAVILIRPLPKLVDKLLTFLSEDLIKKTCEVFIYNYFNFSSWLYIFLFFRS